MREGMQQYDKELAQKFKNAASDAQTENIETLIATQASLNDPNLPKYLGQALVTATEYEDNLDIIEIILNTQLLQDHHVYKALCTSIKHQDSTYFKTILKHLQDINYCPGRTKKQNNRPILLVAILNNCNTEFMSAILKREPNLHQIPSRHNESILVMWAREKYFNTLYHQTVLGLINNIDDALQSLKTAFNHKNKSLFKTLLEYLQTQYEQHRNKPDTCDTITSNLKKIMNPLKQQEYTPKNITYFTYTLKYFHHVLEVEYLQNLVSTLANMEQDIDFVYNTLKTWLSSNHIDINVLTQQNINTFIKKQHGKSLAYIFTYIILNDTQYFDKISNSISDMPPDLKSEVINIIIEYKDLLHMPMRLNKTPLNYLKYLSFKTIYNANKEIETTTEAALTLENVQVEFCKSTKELVLNTWLSKAT